MDTSNTEEKLNHIDSLRGIAILMVVITHVAPQTQDTNDFIASLCVYGRMGVQLFFVVSALTLCISMTNRASEKKAYLNYFIRRFFRIAPVYYLGIILYSTLAVINGSFDSLNPSHITLHVFLLHGLSPDALMTVVPGGWSIGVEFLFYFTFPFLYLFAVKKTGYSRIAVLFVIAIAMSSVARAYLEGFLGITEDPWTIIYWNFANQLIVFIVGITLYKLVFETKIKNVNSILSATLFIFFSCASLLLFRFKPNFHSLLIPFFSALSFVSLYFLFSKHTLLNPKFLQAIGRASFSMYIFHWIIVDRYFDAINHINLPLNSNIMLILNFIAVSALTYMIAKTSEKYIEKPGTNLGRRLIQLIRAKESKSSLSE